MEMNWHQSETLLFEVTLQQSFLKRTQEKWLGLVMWHIFSLVSSVCISLEKYKLLFIVAKLRLAYGLIIASAFSFTFTFLALSRTRSVIGSYIFPVQINYSSDLWKKSFSLWKTSSPDVRLMLGGKGIFILCVDVFSLAVHRNWLFWLNDLNMRMV